MRVKFNPFNFKPKLILSSRAIEQGKIKLQSSNAYLSKFDKIVWRAFNYIFLKYISVWKTVALRASNKEAINTVVLWNESFTGIDPIEWNFSYRYSPRSTLSLPVFPMCIVVALRSVYLTVIPYWKQRHWEIFFCLQLCQSGREFSSPSNLVRRRCFKF